MLKFLTKTSKFCFCLSTVAWLCCGFCSVVFHIIFSAHLMKTIIALSALYCIIYLILGLFTDDYGESEVDYRKRCEDAGIEIDYDL